MQHAPELERRIHGATRSARTTPTATAAAAGGTTGRRLRSVHSVPMNSACTTCTATFGSGSRIAITTTTTERRRTARCGGEATAVTVSCAAVPGTTNRGTSAQPTAADTPATAGTTTSASAWRGRCRGHNSSGHISVRPREGPTTLSSIYLLAFVQTVHSALI